MRRCLTTSLSLLALAAPLLVSQAAQAQESANCPPGAWFCEDADVAPPPEATPAQPPPAGAQPRTPPPVRGSTTVVIPPPPPGRQAAPPVVIYQPVPSSPPPQVIIVAPGAYPAPMHPVRPVPPAPGKGKPNHVWHREWGLNLRLEGVAMGQGKGAAQDAGMGGLGLSLRYRPVPAFAIEAGVDMLAGIDYNGFNRTEVPISVGGILFVNPRSRVQFYFIGGADWSHANVESDEYSPLLADELGNGGYQTEYSYFGGHGGIGLEFRLSRRVALNIDGLAFMRHRTDDGQVPEFIDSRGRTTNSSGGGLFRGGITFWW